MTRNSRPSSKRSSKKSGAAKPDSLPTPPLETSNAISPITCEPPDPARVQQVFKWFIQGGTVYDVREAIENKWPGQNPIPLLECVGRQLIESGDVDAKQIRGWCFEATRDLYRKMCEIGDFAGALRAVSQILKMAGNS